MKFRVGTSASQIILTAPPTQRSDSTPRPAKQRRRSSLRSYNADELGVTDDDGIDVIAMEVCNAPSPAVNASTPPSPNVGTPQASASHRSIKLSTRNGAGSNRDLGASVGSARTVHKGDGIVDEAPLKQGESSQYMLPGAIE